MVLGGGVIGVEFASVFRSFGAEVTVVEALPRLVAAEDPAISKALDRAFRKRRITVRTGARFESASEADGLVTVTLEGGETLEADLLLVAVGRGPSTAGLGYEEAGATLDQVGWHLNDLDARAGAVGGQHGAHLRRDRRRDGDPVAARQAAGH